MVAVVAEQGYQSTPVRAVLARAEISSRTFYELFANKEECFVGPMRRPRRSPSRWSGRHSRVDPLRAIESNALEAFFGFSAEHSEEACASRIVAWEQRSPAGKPALGARRRARERRPIDPADQRWVDRVHRGAGAYEAGEETALTLSGVSPSRSGSGS